jgi:hypothetical protein
VAAGASGKLALKVPEGTLLWKEFYLKTSAGPRLIERRLLRKVSDDPKANGGLANGGWRFWTAHLLPPQADGVHGFESRLADELDAGRWLFEPDEWIPAQAKGATTSVSFRDGGEAVPYVFPGKSNCEYCHAGATAGLDNPVGREVLSFGIRPEDLTPESLEALVRRGWLELPPGLQEQVARPTAPADLATASLLAMMRDNCVSCHNAAPRAPGRATAFVLDPGRAYSRAELARLFAARALFMGEQGLPLAVAGSPQQSELVLRLQGAQGRRRMPPLEGGVPDPDVELTRAVSDWIAAAN